MALTKRPSCWMTLWKERVQQFRKKVFITGMLWGDDTRPQLRNRKHFPCFYRVIETGVEVWENEKCCGNTSRRRVFPQLFRVLPNLHECFYNSIETRRKFFLFLLENSARKITKKRRKLDSFIYHQNVDSLHHAMYTSFKFKLLCVSIEL